MTVMMSNKFTPARAFGILLLLIFLTEGLLMLALARWLPPGAPAWVAVIIDVVLLTALSGLFIWRLFVQPLNLAMLGEAARARAVTQAAAESIVTIDSGGIIESFNPAAERMFGYAAAEVIGQNVSMLMPEPDASAHDGYIERHLRTGVNHIIGRPREVVARHRNGTLFPAELNVAEIRLGDERRFTGILRDITERKVNEARIRHLAHFDALTDLPNRVLFYDRLNQAMHQAQREKHGLALFYLDLDGFKSINDTLGHDRGDELLRCAALRLQTAVRKSDTVARLGGDEFAVILPKIADPADATLVAEKIIDTMRQPFRLEGADKPANIGVSIGIALFPEDSDDPEALVKLADHAMYRAKDSGNQYQYPLHPQP